MEIYISTLKRYDLKLQKTIQYIPDDSKHELFIVVVEGEYKKYKKIFPGKNIIILPKNIIGLSANRQWLLENSSSKKVCFLDDDIEFFIRKKNSLQLKKVSSIEPLIDIWDNWLENKQYALVGVSLRNGNNRQPVEYCENERIMSVYAFNRETLMKENIRFDRVKVMQDFDVNLSLLEKGYKNKISYLYCHSQSKGSGAKGGCSEYRTFDLKKQGAYKLLSLHPKSISIKNKITKTGWEGMEKKNGVEGVTSVDVIIHWKKAYKPKRISSKNGISNFL